jgi:formylglycine-generating enzyme required for sulfatase activity
MPDSRTIRRVVVFALVLPALAGLVPARAEKYALLVGVRKYAPDTLRSLAYTEADVSELAAVLERAGYRRPNITVLSQSLGADDPGLLPLGRNIRAQLRLVLRPLDQDDSVFVALAGHGVQFQPDGESYFCPMDADLADENSLIKLSEISQALDGCKAGLKLLLVDACRNNPQLRASRAGERPVVDLPSLSRPFLKRPPGGTLALFSCSPGEVAFEDDGIKHGIFFHYIIEGLDGGAGLDDRVADADGDGMINAFELVGFAEKNVFKHAARKYRREQTVEVVNHTRGPVGIVEARPAKVLTNTIGMRLRLIPAGEFLMGSPDWDKDAKDSEKPQHRVRITRPFYLGTTEVTVGQFRRLVASTGLRTEAETDGKGGVGRRMVNGKFEQGPRYTWRDPGFPQTDDHPVVNVSWNDAIMFCNKLSELEGLGPYYQFGAGSRSGGDGYRLPTEAEWEYACRAGNTTRYTFGDDASRVSQFAWFATNSGRESWDSYRFWIDSGKDAPKYQGELFRHGCASHPVGQKQPNTFGLYDMHGNVWEWCWDGHDKDYYRYSPSTDPPGPSQAAVRVFRGGGWSIFPQSGRSADRVRDSPGYRNFDLGFRVARAQSGR